MPYFPLHRHLLKFHYHTGCCDIKYEKSIERVWTFCCVSELYRFITVVEIEDLFSRVVVQEAYIRCRIKIWSIRLHTFEGKCAHFALSQSFLTRRVCSVEGVSINVLILVVVAIATTREKKLHFLMNRKQYMI